MATLDQLEQALRAADAAGNTEDAQRLAQAYADMRKQQSGPADFSQVKSRVDSTANDRVAPVTDSMSGYEKFMAGVGKSFVDTYEGAKQAGVDSLNRNLAGITMGARAAGLDGVARTIANNGGRQVLDSARGMQADAADRKQTDAALMGTGAGIGGNIGGTLLQILGPGAVARGTTAGAMFLPRTIAGNALQGLAIGSVQPAVNEQERGLNSLIGLAGGGLGAVAGKAASATIGAGKNALASLLGRGLNSTDAAAGQALMREATNPKAITFTPSAVPGVNRTLGEATLDPGLMALENTMRASRRGTFEQIDTANNAARIAQLEQIAGTPQDMVAAKSARTAASSSARNQAMAAGPVDVSQTVAQLGDAIKAAEGRPAVQEGLSRLRGLLVKGVDEEGKPILETRIRVLDNIRQTIGDMLSGKYGGESAAALKGSRELIGVRDALNAEIGDQVPSFAQYLDAYRSASVPINRMQIGKQIIRNSAGAVQDATGNPRLTPAAFSNSANKLDAIAAKATGFKKAKASEILTSDDINAINAIQEDMRRQFARQSSATVGSQTAERLDIGNRLMQRGLMRAVPVVKDVAAFVEQQASDRLKERLAYLMANPAEAKRVLAALDKQSADSVRRVLSQLSFTTGTAAATSASNARGTTPP